MHKMQDKVGKGNLSLGQGKILPEGVWKIRNEIYRTTQKTEDVKIKWSCLKKKHEETSLVDKHQKHILGKISHRSYNRDRPFGPLSLS